MIDGKPIGAGFLPINELKIAKEFESKSSELFKSSAILNWVALISMVAAIPTFFTAMPSSKVIDVNDGQGNPYKMRITTDKTNRPILYLAGGLYISGVVEAIIANRNRLKALRLLDSDMRTNYGLPGTINVKPGE